MNKQSITFSASEQTLEKLTGDDQFASNTVSYVEATFTLGTNWAGFDSVRAVWKSQHYEISMVLDQYGKCDVPAEVMYYKSKVFVNLVGVSVSGDEITDRLTTYPTLAFTIDSDSAVEGTETTDITPSQFDQFVSQVSDDASAAAASAAAAAASAASLTVDSALSPSSTNPVQNKVINGAITDLKEDFDTFVDGFHNLNLFESAELYAHGKYPAVSNGSLILYDNASLDTYIMKVDGSKRYKFTYVRFAVTLEDDMQTPTCGSAIETSEIEMSSYPDTEYIVFAFNPTTYPIDTYKSSIGRILYDDIYALPEWLVPMDEQVKYLIYNSDRNLLKDAIELSDSAYIGSATGYIYLNSSANFSSYLIAVDGVSTYHFTHCRFAYLLKDDAATIIGSVYENVNSVPSAGGAYIAFSFNHNTYPEEDYVIYGNQSTVKKQYSITSGTLSNGGSLSTGDRVALKDGYSVMFKGALTSFTELKLSFIDSYGTDTNYVTIDSTKLTIKNNTGTATEVNHGLTIQNDVSLLFEMINGVANITLFSDGVYFETTASWYQTNAALTSPKVTSNGTVCTIATLNCTYSASSRKLWIFGDSYISVTSNTRWGYYIHEFEYDKNVLLNGAPGCTSYASKFGLEHLLKHGTPDVVVFATGMNDGSDSASDPASLWVTYRDQFIATAEDIEIVFCTIPTVPSVNNEQKNAWVRNSGYRYIDLASAVGAQSDGTWYAGMLSSDNVHPTAKGAKALFSQVLADLPEIMVQR